MLESISESAIRITTHTDNRLAGENNDVTVKKVEKAVEERPVESSQEGQKPESDDQKKSGGYNVDDGGVFYEFYDKNGNVISRTPKEKKPVDEVV